MRGESVLATKPLLTALIIIGVLVCVNNWIAYNVMGVDTEPPQFDVPEYDELTTGEEVFIRVNITDNEALGTVKFYFNLNGGAEVELPVDPGNHSGALWFVNLVIPDDALEFCFHFWANDASGNQAESAHVGPLLVVDDDAPLFGSDKTLEPPTTGDPYALSMNASDNLAVHKVYLVYAFSGTYQSSEMTLAGDDYSKNIDIPSDATFMKYSFNITDSAGNWRNVTRPRKDVVDNDAPFLRSHTPGTPKTGEEYLVAAIIEDNIDISYLYVNHSINTGQGSPVGMQYSGGGIWKAGVDIPDNATCIDYHFYALDDADNRLDTSIDKTSLDVEDIIDPTANAGGDITIDQGSTAAFDAGSSTDNIAIASYKWTFTYDGGARELIGVTASFTFPKAGTYDVVLTVEDEAGIDNTDNLTVIVRDIDLPTAKAGKDVDIDQNEKVDFNGVKSSDNLGIVSYAWTFTYDGAEKVLSGDEVSFKFEMAGKYNVTLNVTDSEGNWHTDVLVVTVQDITLPSADAGKDREVEPGTEVVLNGSGSSDNVGVVSYIWTFMYDDDGKMFPGRDVDFTFDILGEYNITLTVTDEAGNSATDIFLLIVAEPEDITSPTGEVSMIGDYEEKSGRYEITAGETIELDANDSSDDVGISSYKWVINKEQIKEIELEGANISYTFEEAKMYTIVLTVSDVSGNYDTHTIYFTVRAAEVVAASSEEEDGVPAWVIVIVIFGILGLIMMFYLISVIKKKDKELPEKQEEGTIEPTPEPVVYTEAVHYPDAEYIPPGTDQERSVGLESVPEPIPALAPGEQRMQLDGPSEEQKRLPAAPSPVCGGCGKSSEFYAEYNCYWCEDCQDYVFPEGEAPGPSEITGDDDGATTKEAETSPAAEVGGAAPTGVTKPVPTVVTEPAPSGVTKPAPAGVTKPVPAGVTKPAPAGVTKPAPAGVTKPAPTGVTKPAPTGVTVTVPTEVTSTEPAKGVAPEKAVDVAPAKDEQEAEQNGTGESDSIQPGKGELTPW